MSRLAGKSALITGGGAGIGAATALLFCAEGAAVMLVDSNPDTLSSTLEVIKKEIPGARIDGFVADVSDEARAAEAIRQALEGFGRLDVLVNNAAMRNNSALASATPAEWQAMVGVNLIGVANYCKAALPALRSPVVGYLASRGITMPPPATLRWTPRLICRSVSKAKNRSIWLSQDALVGVRCTCQRGRRASQLRISGVLWVA